MTEKPRSIYSSRNQTGLHRGRKMEFGHKLCGHENLLAVRKYDETYRRQRKLINRQLGTKSDAEPYHDMMEAEAGRFLVRSLEKPKGLMQHLRT